MTTRIGINGFGRIGRLVVRALRQHPELELVHVNEPFADVATAAHLLEFDTVHGRFDAGIGVGVDQIVMGERSVSYSRFDTPGEVPWHARGVDVVVRRGLTEELRRHQRCLVGVGTSALLGIEGLDGRGFALVDGNRALQ